MKISVCMIVKNEVDSLERCLKSIGPLVDEVVVVDTGSDDGTLAIARQFTDSVYEFSWCDDFSKARNFSISKAKHDWVLILDADEIVTQFDLKSATWLDKEEKLIVGKIKIVHLLEAPWGQSRQTDRISRFFNKQYFYYEGSIHEQIVNKKGQRYQRLSMEISVTHLGYNQEVMKKKDKLNRNIALLKQSIEKGSSDPYLFYQLGQSYYLAQNYEQATSYFEKALQGLGKGTTIEYAEELVIGYGYALINSARYKDALTVEEYAPSYQGSPDFRFLLGLVYMNNALFDQAIQQFKSCIGLREGKVQGVNSYLPAYNIGVIYECSGATEEAMLYYKQCGEYGPALSRCQTL